MPTQAGLYLYRDLEQRLPDLLKPRYRTLMFEDGTFVPTMPDLQPGSYELVKTVIDEVGNADFLADGAFDIPLVDASASEDRYRNMMYVAGFSINFNAERNEAYAGAQGTLRVRQYDTKMSVAIRAIQEKRNKFAAYGDTRISVTGLLNNGSVTAENSSFNPYTATASELVDFMIDEVSSFHTNSNNVWFPTKALVSSDLFFRMVSLVMPNSGSVTVKDHVQKALSDNSVPFVIERVKECEAALLEAAGVESGGANKDRILLYALDPEVVERHIEMIQLAPEQYVERRGMKTIYPMFGCTSPTIVNYTEALKYIRITKQV